MKIVHILPEFEVGGVETHVLDLSEEQAKMGHSVTVVSAGGPMVSDLSQGVTHITMAVDRKNPFKAAFCAVRLQEMARVFGWDLLHAHSRVPAWIGWRASVMAKRPFVVTCHSLYTLNSALIPYKKSSGAICVSKTVMEHQKAWLPDLAKIIKNGIKKPRYSWNPNLSSSSKFLFIGRLTEVKGGDFLMDLFGSLKDAKGWTLEIGGVGPLEDSMRAKARKLGISDRVTFSGYLEDVDKAMAGCSCCLFPSRSEGAGLVLMRALAMGVPVMASDIGAFREICAKGDLLPLDLGTWKKAVKSFMAKPKEPLKSSEIYTVSEMAEDIEEFYLEVLERHKRRLSDGF